MRVKLGEEREEKKKCFGNGGLIIMNWNPFFGHPAIPTLLPLAERKIGVEPERRDCRDGIAHAQFHLHSGFLGASEIANNWFRFNGRGAIGTPDPLRPRHRDRHLFRLT